MMNKKLKIVVLVCVGLVIIGGIALWAFTANTMSKNIPMIDRFDDKIVYTTDMSLSEEPFRAHCKEEGGLFNSCGNPCPSSANMCASVCAYTCEDL